MEVNSKDDKNLIEKLEGKSDEESEGFVIEDDDDFEIIDIDEDISKE